MDKQQNEQAEIVRQTLETARNQKDIVYEEIANRTGVKRQTVAATFLASNTRNASQNFLKVWLALDLPIVLFLQLTGCLDLMEELVKTYPGEYPNAESFLKMVTGEVPSELEGYYKDLPVEDQKLAADLTGSIISEIHRIFSERRQNPSKGVNGGGPLRRLFAV
ncbi:hypothetical protein EI42_03167 [Thermosporothrix hazakensis]|jgi:transcriptional regulator with XRE-family HTH domain|uniref:Uncharacterized protein n=1 Tax=Thermosporothrix hazakensis TaxID=644383 RepID=A0A326U571_THEHA|nr:hypothetical protein [Thermosporothrix hazakensis]PZW28413.1 hypothetical protein EI42_03167 [Thermosporothrix hazakensis]GCE45193.1 hypothetical protein KTH_00620 [Thermosporothrix hazakensis]